MSPQGTVSSTVTLVELGSGISGAELYISVGSEYGAGIGLGGAINSTIDYSIGVAHALAMSNNGSSSYMNVDANQYAGTLTVVSGTVGALAAAVGPSNYSEIYYACDITYVGGVSSGDNTTVLAILKKLYGTP
jgi:hypothetical protein